MPYNFAADSFHTKKLCSRLFKWSAILEEKRPFRVFEPLLGQRTMIILGSLESAFLFLLVSVELFSLGVMAEALRVIICSKSVISLQQGSVDPKFQVEGVAPTNYSFS